MKKQTTPAKTHPERLASARKNSSVLGEVMLWKQLSGRQLMGCFFHREKQLLGFTVDFFCPELRLVVEVDKTHRKPYEVACRDANEELALHAIDVHVIRFTELQVRFRMDAVLTRLREYILWYEAEQRKKKPF